MELSLRSYLIKAKYLLVFINQTKQPSPLIKHTGVHIPSIDFKTTIKAAKSYHNPLKRILSQKEQVEKLKKLFFSENTVIISLVNGSEEKNNKTLRVAKVTSSITEKQNLTLFHYGLMYSSNHFRRNRPKKWWKIPCPIVVTNQFQCVLKTLIVKSNIKNDNTFTIISQAKDPILETNESSFSETGLALEKEYSQRRNYLTTNHLYT